MEAQSVERDLAAYYDREGVDRAERELAPERIEARTRFLAGYTQAGQRSLEVGTGPGRDIAAFVTAGIGACGVDLSPVFARYAAGSGANIANATARALPFRHDAFDVIWSMSTLMHIPDDGIGDAVSEIGRVLRPGGVACIGVWGGADGAEMLPGRFGERLFVHRSEATWRQMLSVIGPIREFEIWDKPGEEWTYHWAVLSRTL